MDENVQMFIKAMGELIKKGYSIILHQKDVGVLERKMNQEPWPFVKGMTIHSSRTSDSFIQFHAADLPQRSTVPQGDEANFFNALKDLVARLNDIVYPNDWKANVWIGDEHEAFMRQCRKGGVCGNQDAMQFLGSEVSCIPAANAPRSLYSIHIRAGLRTDKHLSRIPLK